MIVKKKYFSIAEVVKITGLSANKLRYIEKYDHTISVVKARGRRYYTQDSIDYLTKNYSQISVDQGVLYQSNSNTAHLLQTEMFVSIEQPIILRIDDLLDKLYKMIK